MDVRNDLFSLWNPGSSGILHANVGSKLSVSLGFKLLLHLFQVFANERIRRIKHPVTLGAPESLEGMALDPYSLARHCRIISLGWLSSSVVVFFGCDGNVNVSALFEPHVIAMLVSQRVFNSEVAILVVGLVNSNLSLLRLARTRRRNDFVDHSGHGSTWRFYLPRSIHVQFCYSCGPGHAWLRHFLLDAGMRCSVEFLLTVLMQHAAILTSRWKPCSPFSHSCENMLQISCGPCSFRQFLRTVLCHSNAPLP